MPEMSNLDVALKSFWQLAGHWKQGETAKLELSCGDGNLHLQLTAQLGHPDAPHFPSQPVLKKKSPLQMRRQERRRQEALNKETASNNSEKIVHENVSNSMAEKSAKGSKLTEKSTDTTTEKLDNSSVDQEEPTCEAAPQVQSVNKEAAQTSSIDLNTEKFKCDY